MLGRGQQTAPIRATDFVALLLFAETVSDQGRDRFERIFLLFAAGPQCQDSPLAGGEHHYLHDALGVHVLVSQAELDAAREGLGEVDELRRGAGMKPERVDDDDLSIGHDVGPQRKVFVTEASSNSRGDRAIDHGHQLPE